MVLAETIVCLFTLAVGMGSLYLGYKREAVAWYFIAMVVFAVSGIYSMTIPFVTNSSGQVLGSPTNIVLSGISWIFLTIALLFGFKESMELFRV